MIKKFIITICLFLVVFFLIDKLFYWKIQSLPNRELDKRLEMILEGKMNKDILIFGSSRAQHDLYSDAIQDSLNLKTYNLGYRGSNINFHLYLLKKVLKHNKKPKFIILTVDDSEFLSDKKLQFRFDKLYPLVKYQEIVEELVKQNEISPFSYLLFCARLGKEQFMKSKSEDKFSKWTATATVLLEDSNSNFTRIKNLKKRYDTRLEIDERLNAFSEFQNICKKKNISLYIVVPPNYAGQNREFIERVKKIIINEKFDFYFENNSFVKKPQFFYDESHLNRNGAFLYTNEIIKKVKLIFGK